MSSSLAPSMGRSKRPDASMLARKESASSMLMGSSSSALSGSAAAPACGSSTLTVGLTTVASSFTMGDWVGVSTEEVVGLGAFTRMFRPPAGVWPYWAQCLLSAMSERGRAPHEQANVRPHVFMCVVRSSLTAKALILQRVQAKRRSPSKCRRRKCFFAWYLVAKTLGHAEHCTGAFQHCWSAPCWRCVAMWNMRLVSRLKVLRQTSHTNERSSAWLSSTGGSLRGAAAIPATSEPAHATTSKAPASAAPQRPMEAAAVRSSVRTPASCAGASQVLP
mmetsp:Transcript_20050/g.54002  ORF Transcript_20050/g.54002 Transcript_20050/m.54002 type:complete len:277 (-) Transcript_20050:114-944(-)